MAALVSLFKQIVGILSAKSGSDGDIVYPLEIFGKEVDFILTLMENFASKILIS